MFHHSNSFCWIFNNTAAIKLLMQASSYLLYQIPPSTCLLFIFIFFSVTVLPTLNQKGFPILKAQVKKKSSRKKSPKATNHILQTTRQHRTQEANLTSSHSAYIGADMDCLHSCVTYGNKKKLAVPEVLFCSTTFSCFPWVFDHFSRVQDKNK